jgi:glyoxylase-like metal-dependent hydrolase (beta-lactamase superfamily II)
MKIKLFVLFAIVAFVLSMPFIFNKSVTITDPHHLDEDDNFILHEWTHRESKAPDWDYNLKPVKVSDRVWCFFGAMEMPTKDNGGNMSNSCYIKGKDSWITWDTGPSYIFAKQAYEAMSKIAKLPVKTVIISHEHDDHWLGTNYYKEVFGAEVIGPESINENYYAGQQTRMIKALYQNQIRGTKLVKVDKWFDETTKFNISGVNMEYVNTGNSHSEDDFFLYLPDDKVILVADLVMNGRVTSNRDGRVIGQIHAIKQIKKRDWNVLVPGHGFIIDKTAADEATQYFDLTKTRVLDAIDEEVVADDITRVVTLKEFEDKDLYYLLSPGNVYRAYEELQMYDGDDDEDLGEDKD